MKNLTKEQALAKVEELKISLKELESYIESQDSKESLDKERDEWFIENLKDLKYVKYEGNSIKYYNSDNKWMIQDWKNGVFWLSNDRIWSVLEDKYGMKYGDVQQYTKTMLLEHTNWKVEATYAAGNTGLSDC